jgi:hypothetical protein
MRYFALETIISNLDISREMGAGFLMADVM